MCRALRHISNVVVRKKKEESCLTAYKEAIELKNRLLLGLLSSEKADRVKGKIFCGKH